MATARAARPGCESFVGPHAARIKHSTWLLASNATLSHTMRNAVVCERARGPIKRTCKTWRSRALHCPFQAADRGESETLQTSLVAASQEYEYEAFQPVHELRSLEVCLAAALVLGVARYAA